MGRRALILIVALLLAGAAAFAIFQYLRGVESEITAGQERVTVFRAVQPIAAGQEGTAVLQGGPAFVLESFELNELLPDGAITTQEQLQATLSGKVALAPIPRNQLFTTGQWVTLTTQITPLAELIGEGLQAITISPGSVQGVNGFPVAGDRVNVIVSLDIEARLLPQEGPVIGIPTEEPAEGEATEEQVVTVSYTRFVLQGLPVIAVGRDVRPLPEDQQDPTTVTTVAGETGAEPAEVSTVYTLEVTPEQAERLVFAQQNGSIYLTLVPLDFVEVDTVGITIETLFEGDLLTDIFGQ
jgi:Flp pilus assembly protein CpaB